MPEDQWVTRSEAAQLAQVHVRTVDKWANEGRITRRKVGGLQWVRFSLLEIMAMRDLKTPEDE